MTVPKKPLVGFLTAGLMLLAASPGQANQVAGATYTGTYDGGTVAFDVSADGTAVTYFGVTLANGRSCSDMTATPAIPINGRTFAGPFGPWLSLTGSFPGRRSAEGTFAFRDVRGVRSECPDGIVPWRAAVDKRAPALRLGGARTQSIQQRNLLVVARCPDEPCTITARGTVTVPGSRRFKLDKAVGASPVAYRKATLKLRISPEARAAIKQSLGQGEKVVAKVRVTARDHGRNVAVRSRTIRLRRIAASGSRI